MKKHRNIYAIQVEITSKAKRSLWKLILVSLKGLYCVELVELRNLRAINSGSKVLSKPQTCRQE
jgi:hypothetical protein